MSEVVCCVDVKYDWIVSIIWKKKKVFCFDKYCLRKLIRFIVFYDKCLGVCKVVLVVIYCMVYFFK